MATIEPYQTTNGATRYRVRYRTPDRRQTDKRGFATKRDARAFLSEVESTMRRGEYVSVSAGRTTVGDLGPVWISHRVHVKPSTTRTTEVAWRVHVEPRWGTVRVADVTPSAVAAWVAQMIADGSGPVTVTRAHGVLSGILGDAVRDRRIVSNPAAGVKLPRRVRKPHPYLTHEQVETLAAAAGGKGVIVRMLAYTGLRWGELAALRVCDLDLLRRHVAVERNAVNVGGTVVVGTPKSHERRTVPLSRFLVDDLARVCEGRGRDALLFPARDGGYAKSPGSRTWFSHAVDRCRAADDTFPRITPHDLRHTAASLAVSSGANVKAVQRMLGHAKASMTLDTYADLFDEDLAAVGTALDTARSEALRRGSA